MRFSGHKDHKLPSTCLRLYFSCIVLSYIVLPSALWGREMFVQQVLCMVNCQMRSHCCINNEHFCIHRHFDSNSDNISPLFYQKKKKKPKNHVGKSFTLLQQIRHIRLAHDLIFLCQNCGGAVHETVIERCGVRLLTTQKPVSRPSWSKGKFALFQMPATGVGDVCPKADSPHTGHKWGKNLYT